jgi:hypothetical protein
MRIYGWLAGLILVLAVSAPASAQGFFLPWLWSGASTSYSTQNQNAPIAQPIYQSSRVPSSMTSWLRPVGDINNTTVIGTSTFPTPKQLPGMGYMSAFQLRRGQQ